MQELYSRLKELTQKILNNGQFVYFGLEKSLINMFKDAFHHIESFTNLNLNFHIDGIPVYKSSSLSFWPILCTVFGVNMFPFVVALFCGQKKPDVTSYFDKFCTELQTLMNDGVIINSKRFAVSVRAFIADAPAKAYIKQIKQHGGYHACDRCVTKGNFNTHNKSVSYGEIKAEARTDKNFRDNEYPEHHVGKSPLEALNIDMIKCFPFDYMHLVLLGIMRKLLYFWVNTIPFKFSVKNKKDINDKIILCRKYLPLEFNRLPRTFQELDRWKATEYRTFLLYLGPVLLSKYLPEKLFNHFLLLSLSIRILCNPELSSDPNFLNYADMLNCKFVTRFSKLYSNQSTVYNIHCLLHIVDDVKQFGHLDNYSAFPFENFLGMLRKKVRSGWKPLEQVARRSTELQCLKIKSSKMGAKNSFEITGATGNKFIVPSTLKDSCVIFVNGDVALVTEKNGNDIKVDQFVTKTALFTEPVDTSSLFMYKVSMKRKSKYKKASDIIHKCVCIPYKDGYAVLPMV